VQIPTVLFAANSPMTRSREKERFSAAFTRCGPQDGGFLIRGLDVAGSVTLFFVSMPIMLMAAPYKLRTMIDHAEENTGSVWAQETMMFE